MSGSASSAALGDSQVELVEVHPSLPELLDRQEFLFLKFLDVARDAAQSGTHIFGQRFLSGKTIIVAPGVAQKHGVGAIAKQW